MASLIDRVLDQMKLDFDAGDMTSTEALLRELQRIGGKKATASLKAFLPEEGVPK